MVEVTTPDGHKMELPIVVAPGQHDQTLTIAVGYGRTAPRLTQTLQSAALSRSPLRVAGWCRLQRLSASLFRYARIRHHGVTVKKVENKTYPLATTQEHNSMEGRGIAFREASLDKYHRGSRPSMRGDRHRSRTRLKRRSKTGYQNYESGYDNPALNSKDSSA